MDCTHRGPEVWKLLEDDLCQVVQQCIVQLLQGIHRSGWSSPSAFQVCSDEGWWGEVVHNSHVRSDEMQQGTRNLSRCLSAIFNIKDDGVSVCVCMKPLEIPYFSPELQAAFRSGFQSMVNGETDFMVIAHDLSEQEAEMVAQSCNGLVLDWGFVLTCMQPNKWDSLSIALTLWPNLNTIPAPSLDEKVAGWKERHLGRLIDTLSEFCGRDFTKIGFRSRDELEQIVEMCFVLLESAHAQASGQHVPSGAVLVGQGLTEESHAGLKQALQGQVGCAQVFGVRCF